MFVDVSVSKIKRAKSIVMQRMYDATKGDYGMVFDYQLELLISNPGSTVVVKLDTDEPQQHS
jgi:alpha-galactosidase